MDVIVSTLQIFAAQFVTVGILVLFAKYGVPLLRGLPEPSHKALPNSKRNTR